MQVRAINTAGNSLWSDAASAIPTAQVPAKPAAPVLTIGNQQLGVTWTAPADNGASISDYDVQYKASSAANWTNAGYDGTGPSTTITGLTNGQSYQVQVRAINTAGNSLWSDAASAIPTAQVPAKPAAPVLTIGNQQLGVTWTAPADNGASISDYDVQYKASSAANWTNAGYDGTGPSTTITGLTNGQSYQVQVRAINTAGNSLWSDAASAIPTAQVPAKPAAPVLTIGNQQLGVTWTAPADNGASISDYDVQYKASSAANWTNAGYDGTGPSTTITGLTNGQSYQVQVRAINTAGNSPWSDAASAIPTAQVPAKPAAPVLTIGNQQLGVTWTAPADNGASISDYDVQYKPATRRAAPPTGRTPATTAPARAPRSPASPMARATRCRSARSIPPGTAHGRMRRAPYRPPRCRQNRQRQC